MFPNPTTSLKGDFLHPIPEVVHKNLCKVHREDLTVEQANVHVTQRRLATTKDALL